MSEIVVFLGKICCGVVLGIFAGHGAVYVFNKIPAVWLCKPGQQPDALLTDKYTQRVKGYPWKLVFSASFVVGLIRLLFFDWFFAAAALVACWALLEIAIADSKYHVIPDPFLILLAISSMGFIKEHHGSFFLMLGGMALGGLAMLLALLIDQLIIKKEIVRFKDVFLYSILGLSLGLWGIAATLIINLLTWCIFFVFYKMRYKYETVKAHSPGLYAAISAMIYIVIIWPLSDVV